MYEVEGFVREGVVDDEWDALDIYASGSYICADEERCCPILEGLEIGLPLVGAPVSMKTGTGVLYPERKLLITSKRGSSLKA